ncbi:nucleotidyltransferase [Tepidanaerobacter acetatoxydans]|uniref:nucleotidyltransferase n=1 Tax=Tepidanaerobacter acetatoxydans TaxID=499229 RepID=UPI001BD35A86|nr:nucleotidyltransferase [Tepidanaerobacter acetatoxydans]
MNIVGIIAEYNPFHNGHLYQLCTVRKNLKPDGIIVIMSGNFVQRGEPAVFSKWARAEMALCEGADLVIELPVCFSTATAEIFAESAVKLLLQSQVVNTISFGIERYCEKEVFYLGKLLSEEPDLFKHFMNSYLKKGLSFPAAREKAVIKYMMVKNINLDRQLISDLLKKPNYILAVEYIKAINKLEAGFSIFPVLRQGHGYHDKELTQQYASASAIRQELFYHRQDFSNDLVNNLPDSTLRIIKKEIEDGHTPIFLQDFETILLYALRRMSVYELKTYFDVAEGLENRIKKAAQASGTLEQLISQIKSKRYPVTRIQRILMHILLNVPKEIVEIRSPQYLRVLGFTQKGALILKKMNSKATVPVITRASEYKNLNQSAKIMFEKDLLASDVYSLVYKNTALRNGGSDFRRSVIYFNSSK